METRMDLSPNFRAMQCVMRVWALPLVALALLHVELFLQLPCRMIGEAAE